MMLPMKPTIADGHTVTMHYRLTLDNGTVVDESFGGEPLVYQHGAQNIVPGLERQLTGKSAGDECKVSVEPTEGYGEYDPAAEQPVPRTQFPPDADLQSGMSFQAQSPQGTMVLFIRRIEGDDVVVTSNHPLAGERLNFEIQIVDVTVTTEDEKKAGEG